jgi:hypothetical protein
MSCVPIWTSAADRAGEWSESRNRRGVCGRHRLDRDLSVAQVNDSSNEETDEPLLADRRNFYKVEKWTKDGRQVDRMLWAGNSIDKARETFRAAIKRRPRGRYSIRQRSRMLAELTIG